MVQYFTQNTLAGWLKDIRTCNLEAVSVTKCNKVIFAIIHGATVL